MVLDKNHGTEMKDKNKSLSLTKKILYKKHSSKGGFMREKWVKGGI